MSAILNKLWNLTQIADGISISTNADLLPQMAPS